jgi:hypothetical protein
MVDSTSLNKKSLRISEPSGLKSGKTQNLKIEIIKRNFFSLFIEEKEGKTFFWWFCYVELRLKTITDVVLGRFCGDNKQP